MQLDHARTSDPTPDLGVREDKASRHGQAVESNPVWAITSPRRSERMKATNSEVSYNDHDQEDDGPKQEEQVSQPSKKSEIHENWTCIGSHSEYNSLLLYAGLTTEKNRPGPVLRVKAFVGDFETDIDREIRKKVKLKSWVPMSKVVLNKSLFSDYEGWGRRLTPRRGTLYGNTLRSSSRVKQTLVTKIELLLLFWVLLV
ncbi:uncharacterized protein LY89DRAFT_170055 [Mollisia scopiformis]|uniref:Uncharacterized protein n=1 Tax=Mollisia scopiformis TaxID=149040 RepID=A0A194XS98_MOLSC|nr:uncharacterized protein LY89DRAFT_170055 [Mollisia scopiformis]KUJ23175.1 hypothetical protein LY89DRAFT_170055 [Mollisia scopiformis]